jgi:hypothetical protein
MRLRGYVDMAAAAVLMVLPNAALASYGKAGLWETTTTSRDVSGQSFKTTFCMTQAEVDSDKPRGTNNQYCKMTKTNVSGQSYSADMACTGPLNGTSHFSITYDTPEHYSGASVFKGTAGGQPMNTATKFEGKWLKADCGDVKPYTPPK